MNVDRLVEAITWIPHLPLMKTYDHEKMLSEFLSVPSETFQGYRSSLPFPEVASKIEREWHGASLFSPDGSIHSDLTENGSDQGLICQPTPLAERMPYMTSIVDDLGGQDRKKGLGTRARIMIVMPGGSLTWHSHQVDGVEQFRPWITVVHVPIVAPKDFRYSIVPLADFRLLDHEKKKMRIFTENYEAGSATLFNSVHMHNVFNDSNQARISLMLYLDLNNEKTFKIVDEAVANYRGPYIER